MHFDPGKLSPDALLRYVERKEQRARERAQSLLSRKPRAVAATEDTAGLTGAELLRRANAQISARK